MVGLFALAAVAYGLGGFGHGVGRRAADGEPLGPWADLALAIGLGGHAAVIAYACTIGAHPASSIVQAIGFAAWLAVGAYLGFARRQPAVGLVVGPVALVALAVSYGAAEPASASRDVGLLIGAHVASAAMGLGGALLAAVLAASYLLLDRQIRAKRPVKRRLGSLSGLERMMFAMTLAVTPLFTVAIVTGVVALVQGAPGQLPVRSLEVAAAAIAWASSVAVLASRAAWGLRGRKAAYLSLASFAALLAIVISYLARS